MRQHWRQSHVVERLIKVVTKSQVRQRRWQRHIVKRLIENKIKRQVRQSRRQRLHFIDTLDCCRLMLDRDGACEFFGNPVIDDRVLLDQPFPLFPITCARRHVRKCLLQSDE